MPEAIPVFDDPNAITFADDESESDERRFVTLGMGATGRLLVLSTLGAARTSESFPHDPLRRMSAISMGQNYERSIRFQQGKTRQSSSAGT